MNQVQLKIKLGHGPHATYIYSNYKAYIDATKLKQLKSTK